MTTKKKTTKKSTAKSKDKVTVTLEYPSHFKGVEYEPGDHLVDPDLAPKLEKIDKIMKQENR